MPGINADLSKEAEENLLRDDSNPAETTVETNKRDPMFVTMQNVNKSLGAMADSLVAVKQSLKRLHSRDTDEELDPKRRKHGSKDDMSDSEVEEDNSDAEFQVLFGTEPAESSNSAPEDKARA